MFYKKTKKEKGNRGFTLLELLAVIAIIGILTVISVGNYGKFTNDVVLTNMAYELALSIREAQVYGIAVTNQGGDSFDNRYGISFNEDQSEYFLFVDDGDNVYEPSELKKSYTLQKGVVVSKLKISSGCSSLNTLPILFKRPNPEPIINGGTAGNKSAQIELTSREGTKKYVIVSGSGQIFVTSETSTNLICPF